MSIIRQQLENAETRRAASELFERYVDACKPPVSRSTSTMNTSHSSSRITSITRPPANR